MKTVEKPKEVITANKAEPCTVLHGQTKDGKTHIVGIGNLKVVIVKDGENVWFAQGLDIDYASQGTSVANVKENFENGLAGTLHENLKAYSDLSKMLKPAPPEIWQEFLYGQKTLKNTYWQVSVHQIEAAKFVQFPFTNIEYLEAEQIAA